MVHTIRVTSATTKPWVSAVSLLKNCTNDLAETKRLQVEVEESDGAVEGACGWIRVKRHEKERVCGFLLVNKEKIQTETVL